MDYGIQLYSLRDAIQTDYRAALEVVAGMGYQMVETFGGMGPGAQTLRGWLDELGLVASGTHTHAAALTPENLEKTIADHHTIGCNLLIIPGHDLKTAEKIDEFVALVNKVQPILEKAGITLAYHNHSHEFLPNADGQIIYDELRARTQMKLELDTYWAFNAKQDVLALMEELGPRLVAIHLKDGDENGHGYPLGQGVAPVKAIREKAIAMGLPMIVESETLTPDGPAEAQACMTYLRSLEK